MSESKKPLDDGLIESNRLKDRYINSDNKEEDAILK
jgi:hypothetical protein